MLWMRHRHPEALLDLGTGLLLVLILLAGLFVGTSQYLWAPRQGPESNPWYFFFFTVDRFNSKLLLPWVSGWLHKCLCIFCHCTTLSSSSGQPYTHGASHYKLVRHSRRPSWDVWIGLTDLYIWGCFSEKGVGKSSSLFHVAEVLSPVLSEWKSHFSGTRSPLPQQLQAVSASLATQDRKDRPCGSSSLIGQWRENKKRSLGSKQGLWEFSTMAHFSADWRVLVFVGRLGTISFVFHICSQNIS